MKRIFKVRFAIALLLVLGGLPVMGQQTFTIASNLPPRLVAGAGVSVQSPPNVFDPFVLAPNAFHTGGSGSYTVLWSPSLGLNDPTLLSPTMTFPTPALQGQYVLTVTDGNGCIVQDTVMIDFSTDSKDGRGWDLSMTLAPNPSTGSFTLLLQGQPSSSPLRMRVTDALGRLIRMEEVPQFSGTLNRDFDLQGIGAGVYFLAIENGARRAVRSFVIR